VSFVAQKLAELHADAPDMSIETIGRITTENAKRLFRIA
jgi:Tat protein secretion system quality control protein TatD with DNase activity